MAAVGALAAWIKSAISKMQANHEAAERRSDAKHEACEKDREAIKDQLAEVKTDVAIFKGCPTDPCGARQAMQRRESFSLKERV